MLMKKRVTFLLGAGASIPAGYSSTKELTQRIMAPSGYSLGTDQETHFHVLPRGTDTQTPLVRHLICWLYTQTREYFQRRSDPKEISYEDLYFLASQLADDATELQNPAILPLADRLACEMTTWPEYRHNGTGEWTRPNRGALSVFCEQVCHVIIDIAVDALSTPPPKRTRHLERICDVLEAEDLDLKGIATLAHDTHVEKFLRNKRIRVADGFSDTPTSCGWRIWEDLFPGNASVPFLKLHGSVDWKPLQLPHDWVYRNWGDRLMPQNTVGICSGTGTGNGEYQEPLQDARPLLLTGTFNKPALYSRSAMVDIHYRFRKILAESQTLIVCGYSFGDKAINTQVIYWYGPGRSLVVIDPRPKSELISTARYAASLVLVRETTRFICKSLEDVQRDELMDKLR